MSNTLKLGAISKDSAGVVTIGSIMLNAGGDDSIVGASVTVAADSARSVTLNKTGSNYGTLSMDAEGNLVLIGGAALNGEVVITNDSDADAIKSLTRVDFSAPVSVSFDQSQFKGLKTVNGSTGTDSIAVTGDFGDEFVLDAGAGNDTVVIENVNTDSKILAGTGDDLVSVTGNAGNVALGAGKDTLVFGAAGTVNLTDYNFNEDVIDLAEAGTSLTADGKLVNGASVVTGFTATSNLYLARIGNSSVDAATVLATAAEDTTKVNVDASAVKAKKLVINTAAADSANIALGGKVSLADVILNADKEAGVDTIKISDTKASVSVNATNFYTDDVLNFTGLSFEKTTIASDGVTGASLTSGKVTVNMGNVALASGGAAFNLNGTKLYANTASDTTAVTLDLKEEADLSKILVKGNNDKTAETAIETTAKWVDLSASNIYNINKVVLTGDTVAKASVVGTKNNDMGISINASGATDGVAVWANNSSTQKNDMITLSASSDVADTLWFGSADGKDSVTNFSLASDVLYLYDANTMTAEEGVLKIGKAEMSVGATGATETTEEIMQVQGAKFAGTVYAAGDFVSVGASQDVIQLGENAGKVNYYAVKKDAMVSISSAMTDTYTFLKTIDYAGASKVGIADKGSVASIDAGATGSDAKIFIEGVANVTLGAGTNEVYVNGAAKNATITAGTGSDKIWFGANDKDVLVTGGFDTESDIIALGGSAFDYTAKKDAANNVIITNSAKGNLSIAAVPAGGYVALEDGTGAKYKLYAGTAADKVDYTSADGAANIYVGAGILNADSSVTDATTILVDGANNKWGLTSSAAYVDKSFKTINMSGSSADFVLVGSATTANTITGGMGTNYLNGGGASKDTLFGNYGAVDNFYYGKEDGNDTIESLGAEDTVQLYDVATTDLASVVVKDTKTVITLKNDSKLTINGGMADGTTFVLTDGTYTFDSSVEGNWKQEV